ncbi:MAG: major pilin protein FimA [Devosia sp.]|uniref:DUF1028 domain-containing protein n=1 Tax=Devosia sp. TaxID=1871048 RepID=UPI00260FFD0E|nr:DUF1028 domain-containing protein [Devosia sp.]MDB5542022.1 major pilin protein FimA [Devosia sp.]
MTFSIVAIDIATGEVGAAVASKFLAVGNIVPWVEAGRGAVATQALCNASFGPEGLALLGGTPAEEVLATLLGRDARPDRRQIGMVDARGGAASHTGSGCQPWAGHRSGPGYACQGNCLAGPQVIEAMAAAYEASTGPLHARLLAALSAGDQSGGDRRGRPSAAIKVKRKGAGYQGLGDTALDLRVDDHPAPLVEMVRLFALHDLYFPTGIQERLRLEGAVLAEFTTIMRKSGWPAPETSGWSPAMSAAIDAFTGNENLEERVDLEARTIDRVALEHLRYVHSPPPSRDLLT